MIGCAAAAVALHAHEILVLFACGAPGVGQVTPAPVFRTATFIGYVLARTPDVLVATAWIVLPVFVFVASGGPLVPRLRQSRPQHFSKV